MQLLRPGYPQEEEGGLWLVASQGCYRGTWKALWAKALRKLNMSHMRMCLLSSSWVWRLPEYEDRLCWGGQLREGSWTYREMWRPLFPGGVCKAKDADRLHLCRKLSRASVKEKLGCFQRRTIVRRHVCSFWMLLVEEKWDGLTWEVCLEIHPVSSQCPDFITHFQNPYPLQRKGKEFSLYAAQIPLQGFVNCSSWCACNYRRCPGSSLPPASCPCSRYCKRGTSEKCPLFLPHEGSNTPSVYFNHFGSHRYSPQGPMACSFSSG